MIRESLGMEWLSYRGAKCSGRPFTSFGVGASQSFEFEFDWNIERNVGDKAFRELSETKKETILDNHFWFRGYFVSTVGLDEEMIKRYIMNQERRTVGLSTNNSVSNSEIITPYWGGLKTIF